MAAKAVARARFADPILGARHGNVARRMLADTHVDDNLVSARHPYVIQAFMDAFLAEI